MDLPALQARALDIKRLYDDLNHQQRGRTWTNDDFMLGFVGDVGDLAKLVMMAEGTRGDVSAGRAALAHELSDCLWSVLVLAHAYDLDLAGEFLGTMDELEQGIKQELTDGT